MNRNQTWDLIIAVLAAMLIALYSDFLWGAGSLLFDSEIWGILP